jgi:hypothetical protein
MSCVMNSRQIQMLLCAPHTRSSAPRILTTHVFPPNSHSYSFALSFNSIMTLSGGSSAPYFMPPQEIG